MSENATPSTAPEAKLAGSKLPSWLIPLALSVIMVACALFFGMSASQLARVNEGILNASAALPSTTKLSALYDREGITPEQQLAFATLETAANLESYILQRRYHQANVLLLSRVWIRYLGFVTGMILAVIGAAIIVTKTGEIPVETEGKAVGWEFIIKTSSQGFFLILFGTLLMSLALAINHQIVVEDRSTYLLHSARSPALVTELPEKPPLQSAPAGDPANNRDGNHDQPSAEPTGQPEASTNQGGGSGAYSRGAP